MSGNDFVEEKLEIFRYNLALLRKAAMVSGETISTELGVAKNRINNLEGTHHLPTFKEIVLIAHYFKVEVGTLLDQKLSIKLPTRDQ